jgi:hypothetical protein
MNTISLEPHRKALAAVANVRANIEREFSTLLEEQPHVLRLALNEAEAIAWQTDFPHLVFPTLGMEKAQAVADWHRHQSFIRRTHTRLAVAA